VADLLSFSEEQGEARDDGSRWQPWRFELVTGSVHGEKRKSGQGGKKGRRGGGVQVLGRVSRDPSRPPLASRRWSKGLARDGHAGALFNSTKKTKIICK
jgi:hypothetical protein